MARTKSSSLSEEPITRVVVSAEPPFGRHKRAMSTKAERMLAVIGARGVELSVALVGDDAIQGLNRTYRKKDKPTDVLSFPQHDDPMGTLKRGVLLGLLGDVIVSIPQATRQAKERAHPLEAELTVLLAHGILHLFGFDHRTDAEEREMNAFARVLEAAAQSPRALSWKLSVG